MVNELKLVKVMILIEGQKNEFKGTSILSIIEPVPLSRPLWIKSPLG